jgi:hypothetical protein
MMMSNSRSMFTFSVAPLTPFYALPLHEFIRAIETGRSAFVVR